MLCDCATTQPPKTACTQLKKELQKNSLTIPRRFCPKKRYFWLKIRPIPLFKGPKGRLGAKVVILLLPGKKRSAQFDDRRIASTRIWKVLGLRPRQAW